MSRDGSNRMTPVRIPFLLLPALHLLAVGPGSTAAAHEPKPPAESGSRPVVMIGGSFERPPVMRYLRESRSTILYPALLSGNGRVLPLPTDATGGKPMKPAAYEQLISEARERAALLLATLDPEMKRDGHGVIQAALLKSPDPATATCILAPGFLDRFRAVFGPELIVAIPSRTTLYVFPKLANTLPEAAETIRNEYALSPCPVTTEFFEVSASGIRAAGDFRGDR